jgi:hypothetical protein
MALSQSSSAVQLAPKARGAGAAGALSLPVLPSTARAGRWQTRSAKTAAKRQARAIGSERWASVEAVGRAMNPPIPLGGRNARPARVFEAPAKLNEKRPINEK